MKMNNELIAALKKELVTEHTSKVSYSDALSELTEYLLMCEDSSAELQNALFVLTETEI